MPLPRFDVEEARQGQQTLSNAVTRTTRFGRFYHNIGLYQKTIARRCSGENRRFYVAMVDTLRAEIGEVDSSMLVAEDRILYEAIYSTNGLNTVRPTLPTVARFNDVPTPSLPTIAHLSALAMVARLSAQSVVYEVLVMLLDEDSISRSALHGFVDLTTSNRDVLRLFHILMECFEFGAYLSPCPQDVFMCQSYDMPMRWLACMIVRGAKADLEIVLSTIEIKKSFGAFDREKYRKIWPHSEQFSVNPEASVTDREKTGYVGMHLPMGVAAVDLSAVHDAFNAFDNRVQNFSDLCGHYLRIPQNGLTLAARPLDQLDLLKRFNAGEQGLVWKDGLIKRV